MNTTEVRHLSDEALRVKVAELCGWKIAVNDEHDGWKGTTTLIGYSPDPQKRMAHYLLAVPDYPNDLNAMHKAEALKLTTLSLRMDYLAHLFDLSEGFVGDYPPGYGKAHSTARQRAEAFVLVMEGT